MDDKSMKLMGRTLKKEATDAAVNETLKFLNQKKINKSKKRQIKKIAKNILSSTRHTKALKISQFKKKTQDKIFSNSRKRKIKQNKGPKHKKSLIDDDDY